MLAGMSDVGDTEGELAGGVSSKEVALELDLEEILLWPLAADNLLPSLVVMTSTLHSGGDDSAQQSWESKGTIETMMMVLSRVHPFDFGFIDGRIYCQVQPTAKKPG